MLEKLGQVLLVVASVLAAIGLSIVGINSTHDWGSGLPWFIAAGCLFLVALGFIFIPTLWRGRAQNREVPDPDAMFTLDGTTEKATFKRNKGRHILHAPGHIGELIADENVQTPEPEKPTTEKEGPSSE